MKDPKNVADWALPVLDSEAKIKAKAENIIEAKKLSNAAWTSVAIGVVTKKILKNEATQEYPFKDET